MRVLLVSSDPTEYAVERIANAIRTSGNECVVLSTGKLTIEVTESLQLVEYWLNNFSFILFRNLAGAEWSFVRTIRYVMLAASPQLTKRVFNGESYYKFPVFSKLVQIALLRSAGIRVPHTVYMVERNTFPLGFPCVVKAIFGSRGKDVHLVNEPSDWFRLCDTYGVENLIMQEYLPGTHDYRALVIGAEVVALNRRSAPAGDFRTNFAVGGQIEKVEIELADEIKEMALAVAQLFRCDFGGIDFRYSATGQLNVLEINRSPDIEWIEEFMGIPVSKYISEYIIKSVRALEGDASL